MYYDLPELVQIDNFTIYLQKLLGQGAQAKVFEAKQKYTDEQGNQKERIIVAKIMPITDQNKLYCEKEAQIFHQLKKKKLNRNIIQTYHLCHHSIDETPYQISFMEKCESDLTKVMKEKLQKNEWFSFTEIINFVCQIINGYKLLIECNIIHRDLKPDNILVQFVDQELVLKICDFGVGKCLNDDAARTHLGTPVYTPPEGQRWIQTNTPYSNKFDVYSLGMIFYQLAYKGNLPFRESDLKNFIDQLKIQPFVCPPKENVEKEFLNLIEKMITYNVDDRLDWIQIRNHGLFNQEQQQIQQHDPNQNPVLYFIRYLGLIYHFSNKIIQILNKIPQNLDWKKLDFLLLTSNLYQLQNYLFESFEQIKYKKNHNNISLVKSISIKQLEDANQQQIEDELKNNQLQINQDLIKQKIQEAQRIIQKEIGNDYIYNECYQSVFEQNLSSKDLFDYWFLTYQTTYKKLLRTWLQDYIFKKILTIEDVFQIEKFSNIPEEFPKQNYLQVKQSQLNSKIVVKDRAEQYLREKGIL